MTRSSRLLDRVLERDLDLVLVGALFASEPFRAFMLKSAIGWSKGHSLVRTCVSETTDAGESDVLLVVDLEDADRLALMIEDKIDAPFQPEQANRYQQRGEQGIRGGQWNRFATCVCAPEGYLAGARPMKEWSAYISLESISEWARRSTERYNAFIAAICEEAIVKRDARTLEKSSEATAFWQAYRLLANQLLPEIDIARLPRSVGLASPWPRFGAAALPDNLLLEHKPQQGRVDLTFSKSTLEALKQRPPATLPFDIKTAIAGQSAALRIAVPPVDHLRPFNEQDHNVLAVFSAVERLLTIGRQIVAAASTTARTYAARLALGGARPSWIASHVRKLSDVQRHRPELRPAACSRRSQLDRPFVACRKSDRAVRALRIGSKAARRDNRER